MPETNIDTAKNSHLGFGDWKIGIYLELGIWSLGFDEQSLQSVGCKIDNVVTHLQ
jgi:hypothetical protein